MLHITKEKIDLVLQKIKDVMKPEAIGFISLKEGKVEFFDKKTGRYFYLYEPNEFVNILHKNGYVVEKQAVRQPRTHHTLSQSWLTFFVRVNKKI